MSEPTFQTVGKTPQRRHPLKSHTSWSRITFDATFKAITSMRSEPEALPFFAVFRAASTSQLTTGCPRFQEQCAGLRAVLVYRDRLGYRGREHPGISRLFCVQLWLIHQYYAGVHLYIGIFQPGAYKRCPRFPSFRATLQNSANFRILYEDRYSSFLRWRAASSLPFWTSRLSR